MKFVTLVEDTTKCELGAEHGLSIYAETEKHKLLFDVGTTDLFIKNAKALGIDLSQVDTVVISHGTMTMAAGWMLFWRLMTML